MLVENLTVLDNTIGPVNYETGHVSIISGGGIALRLSVYNPSGKPHAVTDQGNPVGDAFDIDCVAHKMGHQLGANHTRNNSCTRTAATATETS
jgi:hypothetical protein